MKTALITLAAAAGAMAGPAILAHRAQNVTLTRVPTIETPVPVVPGHQYPSPNTQNETLTRVPTIETPVPVVPGHQYPSPNTKNLTLTHVPTIETPVPVQATKKKRAVAASVEASLSVVGGVEGLEKIAGKATGIVKEILDRIIGNCTTVACIGANIDGLIAQLGALNSTLTPLTKLNLGVDLGAKVGDGVGLGVDVDAGADLSGLTSGLSSVVGTVLGVAQSVVSLLTGLGDVNDIATGVTGETGQKLASLVASITAKVGNVAGISALLGAAL